MKVSFVLALIAVAFCSAERATAQEAATAAAFAGPTAITFPNTYKAVDGGTGDLRLTFSPSLAGSISQPKLQAVTGGIATPAAGYCTPRCYPRGKNPPDFCLIAVGCPGSGGGGGSELLVAKPIAIEFGTGGPSLDIQLTQDTKTVDALTVKAQALSQASAASE